MWREGASSVFGNNFFPFSRCFHLTGKAELHLHSTVSTTLAYINENPASVWVLAELALTHRYTFFKSQQSRDSCLCSHLVGAGNRHRGALEECTLPLCPISAATALGNYCVILSRLRSRALPSVLGCSSCGFHFSTQWQNYIVTDGISTDPKQNWEPNPSRIQ